MNSDQSLPWDWYPGRIPENVQVDSTAYIESTYSFREFRSELAIGVRMDCGSSVYQGVMFDIGPAGRVTLGEFALVNGGRLICDNLIEIGHHSLISWNVVIMDNRRLPKNAADRRRILTQAASLRYLPPIEQPRPVRIGANVWIGFDACILPGVTIGDGSIIGARSVVFDDIPPNTIAAGNPARVLRMIDLE